MKLMLHGHGLWASTQPTKISLHAGQRAVIVTFGRNVWRPMHYTFPEMLDNERIFWLFGRRLTVELRGKSKQVKR